ncbi:MAG: pirin family protein [Myxococcaceae bacterium]|jgi:hypothetical protein|nr:pirin family protein [Myxococcaceae bacterium]
MRNQKEVSDGSAGRRVERVIRGHEARMGPGMTVTRVLPGARIEELNPFIFLDHIGPRSMAPASPTGREGTGAHPHRGIITFTYLLEGEGFHRDSLGNRSVVSAGGVQWMKAGNGIVHAEGPSAEQVRRGGAMHGLQLWLNLPAKDKESAPDYQSRRPDEIEEVVREGAVVRVLLGSLGAARSTLPLFGPMFVYHARIAGGATTSLPVPATFEVAAYAPRGGIEVASSPLSRGELAVLHRGGELVALHNPTDVEADVLLLGAEPLDEPIVAHGPFVMNSEEGIVRAYEDFEAGHYGELRS